MHKSVPLGVEMCVFVYTVYISVINVSAVLLMIKLQ